MIPSPDEVATEPQSAAQQDKPSPTQGEAQSSSQGSAAPDTPAKGPTASPAEEKEPAPPNDPPPPGFLMYTVFSLLCIGFVVWLIFTWTGYKDKYSQQTEGWRLGSTKMLEITLIKEDRRNLACASDRSFGDIHCGYHANGSPFGPPPENDPHILQPFNTVKNELFLAAGLWQAPILQGTLPAERFTVVCNYHVVGVLKAVSLRWSPSGNFSPVDQSVAVGTLSDCVIPQ